MALMVLCVRDTSICCLLSVKRCHVLCVVVRRFRLYSKPPKKYDQEISSLQAPLGSRIQIHIDIRGQYSLLLALFALFGVIVQSIPKGV